MQDQNDGLPVMNWEAVKDAERTGRIVANVRVSPVLVSEEEIGFAALTLELLNGTTEVLLVPRVQAAMIAAGIEAADSVGWRTDGMVPSGTVQ